MALKPWLAVAAAVRSPGFLRGFLRPRGTSRGYDPEARASWLRGYCVSIAGHRVLAHCVRRSALRTCSMHDGTCLARAPLCCRSLAMALAGCYAYCVISGAAVIVGACTSFSCAAPTLPSWCCNRGCLQAPASRLSIAPRVFRVRTSGQCSAATCCRAVEHGLR